jgi:23S rRNA (cytidine1920-2'-O)/16S rRNA (cytidine1409-2'-O)-methyltransferase
MTSPENQKIEVPDEEKKTLSKTKIRLDLALVEQGFFRTRQEAQTAIMDGAVLVNNEKVTKAGASVSGADKIALRPGFTKQKYVSRGGLKLEKALKQFSIKIQDRVCLDIGASTGGFTDCLLQHGAGKIYAIDVGYGQLDWKLRTDDRVVVKERVNARYLTPEELYENEAEQASLAVIDCSFISLDKILPAVERLLTASNCEVICLIKPQFEAGRDQVKKGVVRDGKVHLEVLRKTDEHALSIGFHVEDCTFSPLKGPKGNIEYLMLLSKAKHRHVSIDYESLVAQAIETLKNASAEDT